MLFLAKAFCGCAFIMLSNRPMSETSWRTLDHAQPISAIANESVWLRRRQSDHRPCQLSALDKRSAVLPGRSDGVSPARLSLRVRFTWVRPFLLWQHVRKATGSHKMCRRSTTLHTRISMCMTLRCPWSAVDMVWLMWSSSPESCDPRE